MATVSVIIPTYNRAHLVSQSIESVLAQTYPDHEIIVVDDGSTDNTAAVVKAYGDRVRYVQTTNGGTGHARNVGMQHARGKYLMFLDSDDLLYPYALAVETRLLEQFPQVSVVCAEVSSFNNGGVTQRYHLRAYHASSYRDPAVTYDTLFPSSRPLLDTGAVPDSVVQEDPSLAGRRIYFGNIFDAYLDRIVLFQNNALYRREVIDAIGPRNEHVYVFEELDYLVRLARRHEVLFADIPTYQLRYHDGQLSSLAHRDAKYRWARTQRSLLRVMKRHIFADPVYYERHKARLDRRLVALHRAVAVPMLLLGEYDSRGARYARYARRYLARCARYGSPQPLLLAVSFAPDPLRRHAVSIVEGVAREGVLGLTRRFGKAIRALLWA
jgi:glycosyltransferase involved in cell wall biosynthesis